MREDNMRHVGGPAGSSETEMLANRIRSEYREMPGLKLTLAQAARFFNLEVASCARALDVLVGVGALRTDGRSFRNATDGRLSI